MGLEQGEGFLHAGADGDLGRRKLGFGVVSQEVFLNLVKEVDMGVFLGDDAGMGTGKGRKAFGNRSERQAEVFEVV